MQSVRGKTIKHTNMFLCGLLLIYCQITCVGAQDIYVAEVMIEGNATMDVSGFVSEMIMPVTATASIVDAEIIAECELVGDETTCWCEPNYIWSDLVCDTFSTCCNTIQCVANISNFTPMCVPQMNVTIFGMIVMSSYNNLQTQLQTAFGALNGFNTLTILPATVTGQNFLVSLNTTFMTIKVQNILTTLKATYSFIIDINATSTGMVSADIPQETVCYNSQYMLNCSTIETMETCTWLLSQSGQYPLVIGAGTEVVLMPCSNQSSIDLLNITGNWAGTYTCLLSNGSVSHSATGFLNVALLPDKINITSEPQTADCSKAASTSVTVTCSIFLSQENYTVTINNVPVQKTVTTKTQNYTLIIPIDCTGTVPSIGALCQISNSLNQMQQVNTTIPIIYPGDPFCAEDTIWPVTKGKETAVILCTAPGRQGNQERYCNGTVWADPIDLCTKAALNALLSISSDFLRGIGATTDGAIAIFDSLKNTTSSGNSYGDVMATVSVLTTMSSASTRVVLNDSLLASFLDSASSVLNTTWVSTNAQRDVGIATTYLSSVENLMKNIQINSSDGHNSSNIQLSVCRNNTSCNRTLFNVDLELNSTSSMVKTMGIQTMAQRLPKGNYKDAIFPSLVVTAVIESDTPVVIRMAYPIPENDSAGNSPSCIFWNTTENQWSDDGCTLVQSTENMSYCDCNHLTSFSMLLSKTPVNLPYLDQLTYIGLGVSICSLIVFLIIEYLVWNAVVKSNLSHFRHISLVNISVCLLIADCAFVASSFPNILNNTICLILTLAKHFFFLGMFFWMLCLSMMLLHQLIFVFNPLRKSVYMPLAIIVGYFFPMAVVVVTYLYYNNRQDVTYFNRSTCWLTYVSSMKGSLYAFLLPIGFIIFANLCSMTVVISTLLKPAASENTKKDDKEAAKSVIKVIVFLTPVFGGTWILGLFVFLMNDGSTLKVVINYAFTIVNSLQGLFILLTGCFGEKRVRDEIVKLVSPSKGNKSDAKKTPGHK